MSWTQLAIVVLVLVGILAGALWLRRQVQIDRCLDAGGRWDYAGSACEQTSLEINDGYPLYAAV